MIFNGTYCGFNSEIPAQFVHHTCLVFHHGMDISVQSNRRVLGSQNLRQRLYIHTAFNRSGRKRVTKRMKAMSRNTDFAEKQFKTALIGSYRRNFALVCDDKRRIASFFHISQDRYELLRNRDHTGGMRRLRGAGDTTDLSVFIFTVMTALSHV